MAYSLIKEDDPYCGDAGDMSYVFQVSPEGHEYNTQDHSKPKVGFQIRVGSSTPRFAMLQDSWQTSSVQEILDETVEDRTLIVRFRTKTGSVYIWRQT